MAEQAGRPGAGDVLAATLRESGSAGHEFAVTLASRAAEAADLADAVHFLAMLHARYPGVLDHAADRAFQPEARDWMFHAAAGFAAERAFLTRLVVAAGSLPSTPGQAQSEAAVQGQSHALAVLSQSERRGTALGAALALVLDWTALRTVLDTAAVRFGVPTPPCDLPGHGDTLGVAERLSTQPGVARAMAFGGQQLLLQHRGLWDLLETRAGARETR